MNIIILILLLILLLYSLVEGMVWIALGIGVLMIVLGSSDTNLAIDNKKQFFPVSPEQPAPKEQMLRVKYQPGWDGNTWWEEMPEHWGQGIGRIFGLMR